MQKNHHDKCSQAKGGGLLMATMMNLTVSRLRPDKAAALGHKDWSCWYCYQSLVTGGGRVTQPICSAHEQPSSGGSQSLSQAETGLAHEAHTALGVTTQTYQEVKSIVSPRTKSEVRVWLNGTSHPTYLALFPESMRSWISL